MKKCYLIFELAYFSTSFGFPYSENCTARVELYLFPKFLHRLDTNDGETFFLIIIAVVICNFYRSGNLTSE